MLSVHDNKIISYNVNLKNKVIKLQTQSEEGKLINIVFSDVLTHVFEDQLYGSIILDIEKQDLEQFFYKYKDLLEDKKAYCWPIDYNESTELERKLIEEKYAYYIIFASYGLNGWVLAKKLDISEG
ncbi:hypothetical protein CIL05_14935 [Virgibacillus profundi]|uniref:Uncharacterized protein n=1 Tax=Virgibacillus profundi TaxID=2024555 RepID=A0A2A2IC77_9BACI|nr:hypothetical protein [Virgibacillus profundi]PAV28916.1 hypothetical protein CIL05_14935 [Virgibacillus profundi]PXY53084.1 hypothetical protein CIT14_15060 [Virgibacillus profundi]